MGASSKTPSKYILTCSCQGTPAFAKEAFRVLFPKEPFPEIFTGQNNICTIADRYTGTNFGNYARTLAKARGKFAHYFEVDDKGDVLAQINLKTGMRVI